MLNSFIKKLIQKIIDIVAPPGAIMMYGGSQVPEGWVLIQNVKVYEDELPRLYLVLAACPELEKGQDEDERKWVKMVNPDGRVPQFTTSGSLVWKLLEAQLPNIEGETGYFPAVKQEGYEGAGALSIKNRNTGNSASIGGGFPQNILYLDASESDAIYSGAGVQVAALQVLVCIKI